MITNPSFISSCRSPRIVKSTRGVTALCRCGSCPDCQNTRSLKYTTMIEEASKEYKYTYFFTLTYNETCVPRVLLSHESYFQGITDAELEDGLNIANSSQLENSTSTIVARSITKRPTKNPARPFKPVPEYNSILFKYPFKDFNDENFQQFYQKSKVISKYATQSQIDYYNSNYILRVLRKKDVQNFLKKLRFNISTSVNSDTDTSISYFLVGEYGPRTFRPHYHGILFFNSPELLAQIKDLLIRSWSFGKVEYPGLARNSGQCCKYVSSYCNSYAYLPDYLSSKHVKPFQIHSVFLGKKYLSTLRPLIYKTPSDFYQSTDISVNGASFHFSPTTQMLNEVLPRCYNYLNLLSSQRIKLLTSYRELATKYNTTKLSDLTRYLLINHTEYYNRTLLSLLDITPNTPTPPIQLSLAPVYCDTFDIPTCHFSEYMITIYNRVYTALSVSRHFISLADTYFNSMYRTFSNFIDDYYSNRSIRLLKVQYETMIEYYKYHATHLTFFDILHNTRKYPITDYKHHLYMYDIFYFNSPNYFKSLSRCSLVQNNFSYKDSIYKQKVKHKELNDSNLIFVNVLNN